MKEFAIRFHNLRVQNDYTLDQLADAINQRYGTSFTKSAFSKWENGRSEPAFQSIPPIAEFFDVSVDYLIGVDKTPTPYSQEEKSLLRSYHALDSYGKRIVNCIIEIELERIQKGTV